MRGHPQEECEAVFERKAGKINRGVSGVSDEYSKIIERVQYCSDADACELPSAGKAFDVAVSANVLHVAKGPSTLLAEMQRVLKDGGMLLTATGCSGESANPISLLPMRMVRMPGIIRYFLCYRKSDIDGLVEQAGWEVVNRDELSPTPGTYFVAARKQSGTVVACTRVCFQS